MSNGITTIGQLKKSLSEEFFKRNKLFSAIYSLEQDVQQKNSEDAVHINKKLDRLYQRVTRASFRKIKTLNRLYYIINHPKKRSRFSETDHLSVMNALASFAAMNKTTYAIGYGLNLDLPCGFNQPGITFTPGETVALQNVLISSLLHKHGVSVVRSTMLNELANFVFNRRDLKENLTDLDNIKLLGITYLAKNRSERRLVRVMRDQQLSFNNAVDKQHLMNSFGLAKQWGLLPGQRMTRHFMKKMYQRFALIKPMDLLVPVTNQELRKKYPEFIKAMQVLAQHGLLNSQNIQSLLNNMNNCHQVTAEKIEHVINQGSALVSTKLEELLASKPVAENASAVDSEPKDYVCPFDTGDMIAPLSIPQLRIIFADRKFETLNFHEKCLLGESLNRKLTKREMTIVQSNPVLHEIHQKLETQTAKLSDKNLTLRKYFNLPENVDNTADSYLDLRIASVSGLRFLLRSPRFILLEDLQKALFVSGVSADEFKNWVQCMKKASETPLSHFGGNAHVFAFMILEFMRGNLENSALNSREKSKVLTLMIQSVHSLFSDIQKANSERYSRNHPLFFTLVRGLCLLAYSMCQLSTFSLKSFNEVFDKFCSLSSSDNSQCLFSELPTFLENIFAGYQAVAISRQSNVDINDVRKARDKINQLLNEVGEQQMRVDLRSFLANEQRDELMNPFDQFIQDLFGNKHLQGLLNQALTKLGAKIQAFEKREARFSSSAGATSSAGAFRRVGFAGDSSDGEVSQDQPEQQESKQQQQQPATGDGATPAAPPVGAVASP